MPLVSSTIPNLINGVSQQPAALRLASQAEKVINCMPSPVEGLKKRPPFQHLKRLFAGSAGSGRPFFNIVDRDGANRWGILLQDDAIKVFDLDGTLKTVNTPDGVGYLNVAGEPSKQFRVASVADYTFIVNREKVPAMLTGAGDKSPVWGTKSMVFVKAAQYNTTYKVKVNATEVTYTTPAVGAGQPNTPTIATNLRNSLSTALGAGWTITVSEYIIEITKNDGADYTLEVTDGYDAASIRGIKGVVSSLTDLPVKARHGFIVKAQGDTASEFDDWYLTFETNAGSGFGDGAWKETVAPGIDYKLDPTTMPHVLVRESNGTFTFKKFDWSPRIAGDTTSAPNPSFVGYPINNITIFRNRLVLLSDENVIMSAADEFERLFPETVQTTLDSDPIDLTCGGNQVNILLAAVPFASTLLLFSRHNQFRMDSGSLTVQPLTPKSANITAMTAFELYDGTDPVTVGRTIYFPIPRGDYSGLREYFLPDTTSPVPASDEVTAAVPRFVPSDIVQMAATISEEAVALVTKADPSKIFYYKFFFQGDQKLQSSWSYWQVEGQKQVLSIQFLDSDLFAVMQYGDGVYLEKMTVRPESVESGVGYELLVDRKANELACTVALTNPAGLDTQTTITLPYPINTGSTMVAVGRDAAGNTIAPGQLITPISQTAAGGAGGNGTLVVRGNLTAASFWVGELYSMQYEFSTPYLKEQPQGGGVAVIAGPRLQLRTWTLIHDKSGHFELRITPRGRATRAHAYNGLTMGDAGVQLGEVPQQVGKFRVPVLAQNIDTKVEIFSRSPLPCRVQSAEWEGMYFSRTERL